jgi:hypothetical protein
MWSFVLVITLTRVPRPECSMHGHHNDLKERDPSMIFYTGERELSIVFCFCR